MRIRTNILLLIGLLFVSASCGRKSDAYSDTRNNAAPFRKVVLADSLEYTILYKPIVQLLEQEGLTDMSDSIASRRFSDLTGTAWFNIYIKQVNGSNSPLRYRLASYDEYQSRYNYFMSAAASDITLKYGDKILSPVSYTFETTYNLTPQEVMVIGFELPGADTFPVETMQLSYFDRIFGNGIIKATYDATALRAYSGINNDKIYF